MSTYPKHPYVLLEDSKSKSRSDAGLLFQNPIEILECTKLSEVKATLQKMEQFITDGFYLAGWLSYECALPFHPTLNKTTQPLSDEPLIWMGVFNKPETLSSSQAEGLFLRKEQYNNSSGFPESPTPNETSTEFNAAFEKIQDYISSGDVYQINHTFRLSLEGFGGPKNLYANLRKNQPTHYGALIETGNWNVLSLSPELFVTRKGQQILSRPMKGTAKPGKNLEENKTRMAALAGDEKNRAENLMITDLIRNDFSRICKPGTVKVPKLFDVESFTTVLQMSSEVTGILKPGVKFSDIYKALFPCGSITGAPKVRAMEIIHETEKGPRGIYTGAIGYLTPVGDFSFNIPIRTIILNTPGKGWLGIGSGVVADSTAQAEYEECLLKARFLHDTPKDFSLVETMLWSCDDGFHLFEEHMKRLSTSAAYFEFACPMDDITVAFNSLKNALRKAPKNKVRLVLDKNGHFTLTHKPLSQNTTNKPLNIRLSKSKVNSNDPFLLHKTSHRPIYNDSMANNSGPEKIYDMIFQNERNEITEGTFNNIFVEDNSGQLLTPSTHSGLLPGLLRAKLLESGEAKQTSLTCDDLQKAKNIFLGNSVRGLTKVILIK